MDLGATDLSLEERPQTFMSACFLINVALTLTSDVSLTPLQILISPRNGFIKAFVRASLEFPLSQKVQKEQFQAEQHTKDVLTGMPSNLPSTLTFLSLASSLLVAQLPHQHKCGAQLAHHHYHIKEVFQV